MNILHLTDFHFRNESHAIEEQNRVIDALIRTNQNKSVDFVFFTGDLVNKGNKFETFSKAKELLFDRIINELNVPQHNIFICEGNHDVHRGQELPALKHDFDNMKNNDDLDAFLDINKNKKSIKESYLNHQNYLKLQTAFYENHIHGFGDMVEPLFSIHKRQLKGKKIGIATLNSAWRSFDSDGDIGNLYIPISIVKEVSLSLKECDSRMLLVHHPLSDLRNWNVYELEDLIYRDFHLMFYGHIHKKKKGTFSTSEDGIFFTSSPATLSLYDNASELGFSIHDFDMENYQITTNDFMYNKVDGVFFENTQKIINNIPIQGIKKEQNDLRKKIKNLYESEIVKANDLFISSSKNDEEEIVFLNLFTDPVLKNKSKTDLSNNNNSVSRYKLEDITNEKNNYIIFCKDKSGKTSLLTKINLQLLEHYSALKIISFYIDSKEYVSNTKLDIVKLMSNYFSLPYAKTEDLLSKYHFKILLDNYNPIFENINNAISKFLTTYKNVSFVITTNETLKKTYEDFIFETIDYTTIYLHDISRVEVRALTNKWTTIPAEKKEHAIEKIVQIFKQLNMPMSYWTVSLFLWIYEKTNDANFHNNFELIQLYIDNLLDKKNLASDKSIKLDYEDFKSFLGELAFELIQNYNTNNYALPYEALVNFATNYRKGNTRFVISVEDLLKLIETKGILIKNSFGYYTFRLNGVFEYFLAIYMNENEIFRNGIIDDDKLYLSFKNEFELYAGFNKKDKEFVSNIFNKTKKIFTSINAKYNHGSSKDEIMLNKIDEVFDFSKPLKQIAKHGGFSLTPEEQDQLMEDDSLVDEIQSDVKLKKVYDTIELKSDNLEKALTILCRVFRNSNVKDDGLYDEVLNFILDSVCNLGFLIIDETSSENLKKIEESEKHEVLIFKLLSNFMPLIIQTYLFDALAQNNLERIFEQKIEELSNNKSGNQLKITILCLMMVDLDIKSNKKYLDDIIKIIDLGVLKQTVLIKLHTYMMFKTHKQPVLENFLRNKIQEQALSINSFEDLGEIHKKIEKSKKAGLLNSSQD